MIFNKIKVFIFILLSILNNLFNPKHLIKNLKLLLQIRKLLRNRKPFLSKKKNGKKAIVYCYGDFFLILLQSFHIIALNRLGYTVIGLLDTYNFSVEYLYKKFGVDRFDYILPHYLNQKKENIKFNDIDTVEKLKRFSYKKIPVGKVTLSTTMRFLKKNRFTKEEFNLLSNKLTESIRFVDTYNLYLRKNKPHIIIMLDRGYTPTAELFEVAIQKGLECVEVHLSHRADFLTFKRYNNNNKLMHFNSLSDNSWNEIKKQKFDNKYKKSFFDELNFCYKTGRWYEEVGTQYKKIFLSRDKFYSLFRLNKNLKTAVLFSHIFWDGTFFYGDDLFIDYEDWFKQTINKMINNDKLNWLVKVHPANKVKDVRDKKSNFAEFDALNEITKKLPEHIKFVNSGSKVSTLSYFNYIDYCITVRGTVGIEAACFGIPVITAGTGRYDGRGFTKDHKNKQDYLRTIENLHNLNIDTKKTKESAIKYAYNLYVCRTFKTNFINFYFEADKLNTMQYNILNNLKNEIFDSVNIEKLMKWYVSGDEDYFESKKYKYTH